jgi:hypothetical protein
MTKQEISKMLLEAAKVIEHYGLQKDGSYGTDDGPKCAVGAMRFVQLGSVNYHLVVGDDSVHELFRAARPRSRRQSIVEFNDAARTRKHDVVELLRDMAAQAGS